jgi:hypothetical protein
LQYSVTVVSHCQSDLPSHSAPVDWELDVSKLWEMVFEFVFDTPTVAVTFASPTPGTPKLCSIAIEREVVHSDVLELSEPCVTPVSRVRVSLHFPSPRHFATFFQCPLMDLKAM